MSNLLYLYSSKRKEVTRFSLDIEYDYSFVLFGISCHEKDYRITWAINKKLGLELKKENDLEIKEKKQKENSSYPIYSFNREDQYCEYFLIANRSIQGLLIPEQKQSDYFLKITGNILNEEKQKILHTLKEINIILTAYEINPEQLKSKQNLLF